MGRASSSKKVARAAGTGGGRTNRGRIPWTYYGVIALVVALGLLGTVSSRHHREAQIADQGSSAPTVGTVWNEGFAIYECGHFLPNVKMAKSNPDGFSTEGDGIIHIKPKQKSSAGKNATLGKFTATNGITLGFTKLGVSGSKTYEAGDSCEGGKGQVYVKQFSYAGDPAGVLQKGDPTSVRVGDQQELVLAFVPPAKSSTIPGPPADVVANLKKLQPATSTATTTTVPAGAVTPTTVAGSTATTVAGSTATTVAGSPTTVAGSTATTVGSTSATTK